MTTHLATAWRELCAKEGREPEFDLDDFFGMRDNDKAMHFFCENFLPEVVGKVEWRKGVTNLKVSDLATVTDEAFALLVLDNVWLTWMNMDTPVEELKHAGKDGAGKRKVRPGLYTHNFRKASRHEGWNTNGLKRMDELMDQVMMDRKENGDWDGKYLAEKQAEAMGGGKKRKRSDLTNKEEKVVVKDELGDISDSDDDDNPTAEM